MATLFILVGLVTVYVCMNLVEIKEIKRAK